MHKNAHLTFFLKVGTFRLSFQHITDLLPILCWVGPPTDILIADIPQHNFLYVVGMKFIQCQDI